MAYAPQKDDQWNWWGPFGAIMQRSAETYAHNARVLLSIVMVRLVPFYVVLWYYPVHNPSMDALAETIIAVPAVAALVRFEWLRRHEEHLPDLTDALLGPHPSAVLRLLGTNLLVMVVALVAALAGAQLFVVLALIWGLVTLLTDQVVIIEGRALHLAVTRSFELVRSHLALCAAVLLALSIPDAAAMTVRLSMHAGIVREGVERGISSLTLPFVAIALTDLYDILTGHEA